MSPTRRDILKSIAAFGVVAALPERVQASIPLPINPARKCSLIVEMFDPATGRETMTTMQIRIDLMQGDAAIGYAHSADHSIIQRTYIDDPAVVAFLNEFLDTPFALQNEYLAKPQEDRDAIQLAARLEAWRDSKKPCPSDCDHGKNMGTACQTCQGKAYVI